MKEDLGGVDGEGEDGSRRMGGDGDGDRGVEARRGEVLLPNDVERERVPGGPCAPVLLALFCLSCLQGGGISRLVPQKVRIYSPVFFVMVHLSLFNYFF